MIRKPRKATQPRGSSHGFFVCCDTAVLFHDAFVQRVLQKGMYEDRERQEERIRYTDLDWIIVRPARVVRGQLTAQYMSLTDMRNVRAR
jgi:hypothetical protein